VLYILYYKLCIIIFKYGFFFHKYKLYVILDVVPTYIILVSFLHIFILVRLEVRIVITTIFKSSKPPNLLKLLP